MRSEVFTIYIYFLYLLLRASKHEYENVWGFVNICALTPFSRGKTAIYFNIPAIGNFYNNAGKTSKSGSQKPLYAVMKTIKIINKIERQENL